MVTTKVILRKDKINAVGEAPLFIRVTKNRQTNLIALGIRLNPKFWDDQKQRIRSAYPNSARANALIKEKLSEVENTALEISSETKNFDSEILKNRLTGVDIPEFIEYAEDYVKREYLNKRKIGTHNEYKAILSKLKTFLELEKKKLYLDKVDIHFLKKYEDYLRNTLKNATNTIHNNLKSIRRIINSAIEEELIPYEKNPFLKYKLKQEKTKKEFLTDEELKSLEELKLTPGSKMDLHRDIFVFSSYVGGLRVSDILQLQKKHFDETHISISTKKTGALVSISLPHKVLSIIEKYKKDKPSPEDHIFPIFGTGIDYSNPITLHQAISSATAYANKDLRKLATKAGIEKKISFHTARHTFATRALKKGMRIEYVSKLLGHASVKTTEIYAKIVNKELDKAMEVFNE